MRATQEIARLLVQLGQDELNELDVSAEEVELLARDWDQFLQVLPDSLRERVVLVRGDSFDDNRNYLLVTHLVNCDHYR